MQTLQAGSFLNLENTGAVEALIFTARLLAEHSGTVIKENLNAAGLENLGNNLWQKAEYVTRETERRRLQQIFVENFVERFRELKPDLSGLPIDSISALLHKPPDAEAGIANEKTLPPESNISPVQQTSAAETGQDEFLGIVKPSERFGEITLATAAPAAAPEAIEQPAGQPERAAVSEPVPTRNEAIIPETDISENDLTVKREKPAAEIMETAAPPLTAQTNEAAPEPAETPVKIGTPVKSAAQDPVKAEEEPFEFGRCTVSLNLVLLPSVSGETNRQTIIGAASHNLPPEIELLEINEGEDLDQIAALVKNKLHRFIQTLPVKYMESLRAKQAKQVKTNQPAPPPSLNQQRVEEKLSGSQTASTADGRPVNQTAPATTATGSLQQNLF